MTTRLLTLGLALAACLGGCDRCPEWRADADGDGFGDLFADPMVSCAWVYGAAPRGGDCNDGDRAVNPGAPELCNGLDDNCDGLVDDERVEAYEDRDGDGYGGALVEVEGCLQFVSGYSQLPGDCDDDDPAISPSAVESCNDLDDDCDGVPDDGDGLAGDWRLSWRDADADGQGDPFTRTRTCATEPGWVENALDCDDADPDRYLGSVVDPCPSPVDGASVPLTSVEDRVEGPAFLFPSTVDVVGDVDGDGVADLAATFYDPYARGVALYTGRPSGTVDAVRDAFASYKGGDLPFARSAGDVDGDGAPDLVVATDDGAGIARGPIAGGLLDAFDLVLLSRTQFWLDAVAAGDADGDGGGELWLWDWDGAVVLHDAAALGVVGDDQAVASLRGTDPWSAIEAADLDGDGIREVFVGASTVAYRLSPNAGAVYRASAPWTGDADLVSVADAVWYGEGATLAGGALAAGSDLDGDGDADLAVRSIQWVATVSAPAAAESLLVEVADGLVVHPAGQYLVDVAMPGDVDGDGACELLATVAATDARGTSETRLFSGPIAGTILWESGTGWTAASAQVISGGDLDGDALGEPVIGVPGDGILYVPRVW